jgi:uncharacterized protein YcfJ
MINSELIIKYLSNASSYSVKLATALFESVYNFLKKRLTKFVKEHPGEAKGTVAGGTFGTILAGILGGGSIGVVGFFGGIGIPIIALTALGGAFVGNRLGIGSDLKKLVEEAEQKAQDRFKLLDQKGIRFKGKENHNKHFKQVFIDAKDTICIRSAFMSKFVVNDQFQKLIISALERNVNIYVEFGYKLGKTPAPDREELTIAINRLRKISEKYPAHHKGQLFVGRTPIHIKEITCDSDYFLSGSNNWLTNKSFKNEEASLKMHDRLIVREIRDEVIQSVKSNQIIPKI